MLEGSQISFWWALHIDGPRIYPTPGTIYCSSCCSLALQCPDFIDGGEGPELKNSEGGSAKKKKSSEQK